MEALSGRYLSKDSGLLEHPVEVMITEALHSKEAKQ
jgi:hypothetical protein